MTVPQTPERREAREDVLLGQVLLKRKFITQDHLKQALAAQAAGVARGRKRPRRLGIILVEQGRIDDQTFIQFLREVEERVSEEEAAREEDRRLAETLLSRRLVTEDQLDECLRLQQESIDRGDEMIRRIGEIFIQEGYVKPEAVALALRDTQRQSPPSPPASKPPPKTLATPSKPARPPLRVAPPGPKPEIRRMPTQRPQPAAPPPSPKVVARPPLRGAVHPKPVSPPSVPKPPSAEAPPAAKRPPQGIMEAPTSVDLPVHQPPDREQAASRPDIPLIEGESPETVPPPSDC